MPRDGTILPLFSAGTKGLSPVISAQRRTNLYIDVSQSDADKGRLAHCPRPGLDYLASVQGQSWQQGVNFRGMLQRSMNLINALTANFSDPGIFAMGNGLGIFAPSARVYTGVYQLRTTVGFVSICSNNTYALAVDGLDGYAFDPITTTGYTFSALGSAAGFPFGATTCAMLASRMIVNKPNSGRFQWSASADPLTWSALDYANAEVSPDNLVGVWVDHGELWLFGKTTTEFWAPSQGDQPFERVGGSALEYGLTAIASPTLLSDGTMFLGRNLAGDTRLVIGFNGQAQPISTPSIEAEWERLSDVSGAVGMTLKVNGHVFMLLSFDEVTYAYNRTSNEWGYWQTGTEPAPWTAKFGALVQGKFIALDAKSNRVYMTNPNTATDGGEVIVREVVTKHTNVDFDRYGVDALGLDFETGVGLTTGQGSNPQVMLQVSRDNARTYGNEVWASAGAVGSYLLRVWFKMLGRGRDFVFKIRWTDPILAVLVGGSVKVRK